MSKIEQFVCLSGLPRTGSTLLSAILSQNPKIHAEGNSAVCQLMWDMSQSCLKNAREQLAASNRNDTTTRDLISQIPHIYYKNIDETESIIVDKCRSWTIPANIDLLKKYVGEDFKIIILERPITEIVKSFAKLYADNNINLDMRQLLVPQSEPIMRSIHGLNIAKNEAAKNNSKNYLFISYDELINSTKDTIDKIYAFCGWEPFEHDFNNVVIKYPEDDTVYGLKGQHKIRSSIQKRQNTIKLTQEVLDKCSQIDKLMGYLSIF
jgi:sulfotransferase